jgi:hypothetical protein
MSVFAAKALDIGLSTGEISLDKLHLLVRSHLWRTGGSARSDRHRRLHAAEFSGPRRLCNA